MSQTHDRVPFAPLTDLEIARVAALLPEAPSGPGPVIDDRAAWQAIAAMPAFSEALAQAEAALHQPVPALSDDLYDDITRTGDRQSYQQPYFARRERMTLFALAECIENRGRFLPVLEQEISAILDEYTWCIPAHGWYRPKAERPAIVDLMAAETVWELATVLWWMQDRLSSGLRARVRSESSRRVFTPYLAQAATEVPVWGWMTEGHNWNAVCNASVVGGALAMLEDKSRRATAVAIALQALPHYLNGFSSDGSCEEGVLYWNYGFGNYLMLAEALLLHTHGRINLYANSRVQLIASYPERCEMTPGLYPSFSDAKLVTPKDWSLAALLDARLRGRCTDWFAASGPAVRPVQYGRRPYLLALLWMGIPPINGSLQVIAQTSQNAADPLRTLYRDGGLYVGRSLPSEPVPWGFAAKGGHNDQPHNHNDCGSFSIAVGSTPVLIDPGAEEYTRFTFSPNRYDSMMHNSYGHPVPVVAGKPQKTGRDARGVIIASRFTDMQDSLTIDLTSAYDEPTLIKLHRRFTLDRQERMVLVEDDVVFATPQTFAGALIIDQAFERNGCRILFKTAGFGVHAEVAAPVGLRWHVEPVTGFRLPEGLKPTRIGYQLSDPVQAATISVRVRIG